MNASADDGDARSRSRCPLNAQICAFLQQQPGQLSNSSPSVSSVALRSLKRYPLPVLSGATASDVEGVATAISHTTEPLASLPQCGALTAAAGAIQRYWQSTTTAAPSSPDCSRQEAHFPPPEWMTHSPFRLCAQPAFHAQLRRCVALQPRSVNRLAGVENVSWTAMDALCHGIGAAAPPSSPLSEASLSRKRRRVASTLPSDLRMPPTASAATTSTSILADTSSCTAGVPVPAPTLRSRVVENDDLLDMLLGESTANPTALENNLLSETTAVAQEGGKDLADEDGRTQTGLGVCPADASQRQLTTHDAAAAITNALPSHDQDPVSEHESSRAAVAPRAAVPDEAVTSGLSARELRETCVRLGLLSTGTKSVLAQRIALYESSQRSTAEKQSERAATATMRPISPTPSAPLPLALAGAPRAANSGSPPRTIFRYRSASQPSTAVPSSAGTTTGTAVPVAATADAAPPQTAATAGLSRRLVPSPTAFLQELMTSHQQVQQRQRTAPSPVDGSVGALHLSSRERCVDTNSSFNGAAIAAVPVASAAAARAYAEALKAEAAGVRWQWLVDFRERAGGQRGARSKHEGMMDAFRRQQVPCTSVMLPSGDFMLAVELSPTEAATVARQHSEAGEGDSSSASPMFGHVCSLVVERKTAADLDASVKGSRYTEQRRLLAAAPFALVVWLIEGTDVGGARSPSPVPHSSASPTSSVESARQRVNSACASLGQQRSGWIVIRTRNTAESVLVLRHLAEQVARQLASRRLACREAVSSSDRQAREGAVDGLFCTLPPLPCASSSFPSPHLFTSLAHSLLHFAPTSTCLQHVAALQRRLRAQTAFPRMLLCVRGCSPSLAAFLSHKYGSMMGLWRVLRRRGREACDEDPEVRRLSTAQKKVFVLLTEFLLSKDYY